MLTPNTIPDKEPLIRVGIVLPEDKFKSIELEVPFSPAYRALSENNSQIIQPENICRFSVAGDEIRLNDLNGAKFWRIEPEHPYKMYPKTGIKVNQVVAGRGFHWEKPIDVYLSGSIEINIHEDHLLLINELPMEEYLMCVATSEMGADCPSPLIESQTIAARSWMLANIEQKHIQLGMDVCNDDCCQRYQGSGNLTPQSIAGAQNTFGQVLIYDDKICDARYSKSCGGVMETFNTIWPGADLDYLKTIVDAPANFTHPVLPLSAEDNVKHWIDEIPETYCSSKTVDESTLYKYLGSVDEEGRYFRWEFTYSQSELCDLLNNKLNLRADFILGFNPVSRGGSGRLSKIEISYRRKDQKEYTYFVDSEYKIRQSFHKGFLYSSCFYIVQENVVEGIPQNFTLKGAGWGHGVGYCQIGALGMALNGYTTEQIVSHYYPGSKLTKIY